MAVLVKEATDVIGVGIDTARYGHRVTFLRADKQPAAPPMDVLESAAGYEQLRQALERLQAERAELFGASLADWLAGPG